MDSISQQHSEELLNLLEITVKQQCIKECFLIQVISELYSMKKRLSSKI